MGNEPSLRDRIWSLVDAGRPIDRHHARPDDPDAVDTSASFDWFDWMIALLIVLNVIAFVLESEKELHQQFGFAFHAFEVFSLIVFTIEYVLRLWACTVVPAYSRPLVGRLKFALRPLQLIDLLAILPGLLFFLPDLRFVRALRLLRILRILKLGRYSDAVTLLTRVLRKRRGELAVMGTSWIGHPVSGVLLILLIVSASALHYAEGEAQPDKFGSITQSLWWAVITLTTIGYGDVFPVTSLGKVLGGFIAIAGIGIVALPTAIVASGFSEELTRAKEAKQRVRAKRLSEHHGIACPHCGKMIELRVPE